MANLKLDLINKVNNEKYYDELELVRLASEPNMNYGEKVSQMDYLLEKIAKHNAKLGLIDFYFQEPAQAPAPAPQAQPQMAQGGAPAGQVHNGQSHGE